MLVTDIVLLALLVGFCAAWLWRGRGPRNALLWAFAAGAAAASTLGVLDGRWQAAVGGVVAGMLLLVLALRRRLGLRPRPGATVVSGALFLLLTGVAFLPLYWFPVFSLPEPQGQHPVGVRDFELTDHSRLGVLFAAADEPRRLAVRVWYPAASVDGLEPRPYATEVEIRTTHAWLAGHELSLPPFLFSHLRHVGTSSFENAPVLGGDALLPVVFFSHGLASHVAQNTALMEHLASLGYVVFSIAHTYDAAPVPFPNGDVIARPEEVSTTEAPSEEAISLYSEAGRNITAGRTYDDRLAGTLGLIQVGRLTQDRALVESPAIWLADELFVVDALATGSAPASIADLLSRADFARVGHMGMSFGGSTAAAAAYADPRCVAAISLDGSDFHHLGINADIPVPFMMLYSDTMKALGTVEASKDRPFAYNDLSYERFETAGLRDDIVRLRVKGTTHMAVTDLTLMTRGPLHDMLTGSMDGPRMVGIVNELVASFFDRYLRGATSDFPASQDAAFAGDVVPHDVSGVREWWLSKSDEERAAIEQRIGQSREEPS